MITLNINSVNKRDLFFKDLEKMFQFSSYSKKFAASFDALIGNSSEYKEVAAKIRRHLGSASRVLEVKAHTGYVTSGLPQKVEKSYVDHRETFLRCIKEKYMGRSDRIRLIKKSIWSLGSIPKARFDGIVVPYGLTKEELAGDMFERFHNGLADHKILSVVVPLARGEAQTENYLKSLHRDLTQAGKFDTLKYQYQGFADYLRRYVSPHLASVETVVKAAEKAGFSVVEEKNFGKSYVLLQFAKLF